jgi:hypothetical protein
LAEAVFNAKPGSADTSKERLPEPVRAFEADEGV